MVIGFLSDPYRIRTYNQLIKSQLLCRIELMGLAPQYYTAKKIGVNFVFQFNFHL